jgi:large subunit ribosomal protein L24
MAIKKGDTIQVRGGKDRGKTGKVLNVAKDRSTVLVEGINLYVKHAKPKRQGEKGQKITLPRSIALSRVNLFCSACGRGVRVGIQMEGGQKVRQCKRCKAVL